MKNFTKIFVVIMTLLAVGLINQAVSQTQARPLAQVCNPTNEILDPASFNWTYVDSPEPHYVGVMEYGEATFNINGETLTTRAYRQEGGCYSIPGPTLNMAPGNRYVPCSLNW